MYKSIEGFKWYQVSDEGQIKRLEHDVYVTRANGTVYRKVVKEIIKKLHKDKDGYMCVGLRGDDGITYEKKVHRLVAEAFIPNPDCLPEVNHKDENKANNNATNLEWCDRSYQQRYGTSQSRKSIMMKKKHKETNSWDSHKKKVICVETQQVFESSIAAGEWLREMGFSKVNASNITAVCKHQKHHTAYGYKWKYYGMD